MAKAIHQEHTENEERPAGVLSPQKVIELFGLPGPYEPPPRRRTTQRGGTPARASRRAGAVIRDASWPQTLDN